MKVTGNYLTK